MLVNTNGPTTRHHRPRVLLDGAMSSPDRQHRSAATPASGRSRAAFDPRHQACASSSSTARPRRPDRLGRRHLASAASSDWTDASATAAILSSAIRASCSSKRTPVGASPGQYRDRERQVNSAIAELTGGGFVVSWADSSLVGGDSSGSGIKAQRFDSTGAKVGGEILVNTATDGNQSVPSVVALPGGGFAAVWTTFNSAVFPASGGTRLQLFDSAAPKVGGEQAVTAPTAPISTAPRSPPSPAVSW